MDWNAPAWRSPRKTIACQVRLNDERGQYETVIGVSVADGSQLPLTSTVGISSRSRRGLQTAAEY